MHGVWEANFAVIEPHVGTIVPTEEFEWVRTLAERYLQGCSPLLEQRIRTSMVIDGHGDLLAEEIFCLPDGPRILDCLAFDERLRHGDCLDDLAFLVMDVERFGGMEAALTRWYRGFSYETHPGSLAHHYVAHRANVRAKIACLRHP